MLHVGVRTLRFSYFVLFDPQGALDGFGLIPLYNLNKLHHTSFFFVIEIFLLSKCFTLVSVTLFSTMLLNNIYCHGIYFKLFTINRSTILLDIKYYIARYNILLRCTAFFYDCELALLSNLD